MNHDSEQKTGKSLAPPAAAIIGLASNLSPENNLPKALRKLAAVGPVVSASSVYESEDMAHRAGHYLNAAVRIDSSLSARQIRAQLKRIEMEMGRTSNSKQIGSVPIDLDLCLLGDRVIHEGGLDVPHPDLLTREYLAKACAEISPDARHPVTGERLSEIAGKLNGSMKLRLRRDVKLIAHR